MFQNLLRYILIRNLSGKELTDEKISDFKRLTLVQACVIFSLFVLDLFIYLGFPYHIEIAETLFFSALGFYVYLLWDMLRNYTTSKTLIFLNFIFIMGVFFIGLVVVNPFIHMAPTPVYKAFLTGIQICLLMVQFTVIYFTLTEFFKKDLSMPLRLWGAACIYLMIGLAFGSIYEIVCVLDIQCMGIDIPLQTMGLMKRYEFSLMVLSGMDTPYGNQVAMIFSLGTIEALSGQLFIVLIVGRLMMK
jgi:hypothetical protein